MSQKTLLLVAVFLIFTACQAPLGNFNENQIIDSAEGRNIGPGILTGQNGLMYQYFHWYTTNNGTWWNTLASDATRLSQVGVTAVWMPPAYKGQAGINDVGYGVYDMYDLGEFNAKGAIRTKYGTRSQYLNAITQLRSRNIQVYGDVVLNHKMGADSTEWVTAVRVDRNNRNIEWGGDQSIQAWTFFNYPARAGAYSSFVWRWYHFDGVDWAQNLSDNNIWKFRGTGKAWDWEVSSEFANYDYLMGADVDFDHPEVTTEYQNWAKWFMQTGPLDGLRIDAVKHIKFTWFNGWLDWLRGPSGVNKNFFAVGEYVARTTGELNNFINKTNGRMSVFDFPLHYKFEQASKSGGSFDMRYILTDTITQNNPILSVPFVDNHDTQPLQALASPVMDWFKPIAYTIILTRQEGYPMIFWADEFGATYTDKGQTASIAAVPRLRRMMMARKYHAYGTQRNYFDHWDIVGWTRAGSSTIPNSGLAALVTDGPGGSKWMEVGTQFAGRVFYDYLGNRTDTVTINSSGWGEFKVNGGSASIWVPQNTQMASVTFTANGVSLSSGQQVYVVGNVPALGSWNPANAKLLGTYVSSGTYRGVHSVPRYTAIEFKFIKKNSSGQVVWESGVNREYFVPNSTSGSFTGTWQN